MRVMHLILVLAVLTACSSRSTRDEDAFLDSVYEMATTEELMRFTTDDFITTGDIACGIEANGDPMPTGISQVTGVEWSLVYWPALDHLC